MDPTANLLEQLEISARLINIFENADDTPEFKEEDVVRLAELVEALHGWIRKGGFLPEQWSKAR
jgi:hypothetical protein